MENYFSRLSKKKNIGNASGFKFDSKSINAYVTEAMHSYFMNAN